MLVLEDVSLHRIVGFGAVVIEPKFIRNLGFVGHIEDVVVDQGLRRKGLGRRLIERLTAVAKQRGCYKVIIDCDAHNIHFYDSCGFTRKGTCLSHYFPSSPRPSTMNLIPKYTPMPASHRDRFTIRPLAPGDYDRGFLQVLAQLTVVGEMTQTQFAERLKDMAANVQHHVIVMIDTETDKVVAAGTLFVEQKFIRNAGRAGHVEDVVVDSSLRGFGLGRAMLEYIRELARAAGCYKAILDCEDNLVDFYGKFGFTKAHSSEFMAHYF
ncbi:uncharacterized protein MONBRDRAFT_27826 [Monosiga brevicollis MX1]|uniref:Glucosamine 6-phosphate N-acetyltransferase n=1 Tax=Monosiga brevicollis TaxID=81824 RepID=A9V6K6_MONBE|nr:uncharacterized protein MONBRDRAFT_27826 [Monosiga brevicollis MX1]EDQ86824.1 predicted protein [Monosiga brevicollis MX1]|eukprot:XP_001748369.1 hypothetical protein [Monosiga brevicollis MX1]